jgi:hypothetical protein
LQTLRECNLYLDGYKSDDAIEVRSARHLAKKMEAIGRFDEMLFVSPSQ